MKETFYFSHDYNARTDSKIRNLIRKHKFLGYGIYWAIIEDLYQNANALPTDYEGIAFDLHTDEKTIQSVICDFDLFIINDGFFGSMSVQRRLDERNAKSNKAREIAMKRWEKNANAMPTQSQGNAIKESKGKDIKGEKEEEEPPKGVLFNFKKSLLDYGFDPLLVDRWLEVRKKQKGVNTDIAFAGFIREVEKSGKDKNEVMRICIEKSWRGFDSAWLKYESPKEKPVIKGMEKMEGNPKYVQND